jgi:regulator of protease activity HflC (stomatin/prohibitin superfamily)
MIRERASNGMPGLPMLLLFIVLDAALLWMLVMNIRAESAPEIVFSAIGIVLVTFLTAGLFMVNPNEGKVLQLFGEYKGSLRVRNFESSHLKVNDIDGNPIEIGAVVVWKVFETAEAVFEVDDYEHYVKVQSEAALRNLATSYAYDAHDDAHVSLRGHTSAVADHLKREIHDRLVKAGVEVIEARISHLAYAPEIAAAMLQRQQAGAIIAARQRIVEGAVGMVEMALDMLSQKSIVQLDEERKAAMVSNLLVVLCGDRNTQPVINTGTIYQ